MSLCWRKPLVSLLSLILFIYLLTLIPSSNPFISSSKPSIGITYSRNPTSNLPHPDLVVSTLRSLGLTHVRILNPDPDIIHAFSSSGISLLLSIPNTHIHAIAANESEAIKWLNSHVIPFYPQSLIETISVGNEVLTSSPELSASLLPAMQNVHFALHNLEIHNISVSTTHSFDIITTPFPSSAAEFKKPAAESFMKPILDFISTINSSFLINAYPYKLYRSYPEIPISYALFQQHPFDFHDDPETGFQYWNLFDVMVDAVISAMARVGHKSMPVIVTETGWPSDGEVNETDANVRCASTYNAGLLTHLRSGVGTPLRRKGATEIYIFELLDDDTKQGHGSNQSWGILNRNMTMKYGLVFPGSEGYLGSCLVAAFVGFCTIFAMFS